MLHAAIDNDAIAGAHLPAFALSLKKDVAADDIDHLMMRMAVARALPTLFKGVAHEHEMGVVGKHLAQHAGLGRGDFGCVGCCVNHSGFVHEPLCLKLVAGSS